MLIDDLLKTLDNPRATISYPQRIIYQSSNGDAVYGLDPSVQQRVRNGEILVPPIQVVRRPGLGDKVFSLAAVRAFLDENPDADVTFSGLDTDTWLSLIPWVKTGLNPECNTVVNLDNTPPNGEDRVLAMGRIMGIVPTSIEFPINRPRSKTNIKKPYYVFAPWAAGHGPRSLPLASIREVLHNAPIQLALADSMKCDYDMGPRVMNCTGTSVSELIGLLSESSGIVACDTGGAFLGLALGLPALIYFSHIRAADRTATAHNAWAIESPALCAKSCGDHIGTRPECRWKDTVPACLSHLTPGFLRHTMREFAQLNDR